MAKERLDLILVNKGYFPTRQQAQRAVMAGLVRVNGERADKPGTRIPPGVEVEVAGPEHPYVSRGGIKLEQALKVFRLDLGGRVVLDVGASTGGFTDCALQNGAAKVYAVDVGYGQLAWKLRQDPRVVVMERTNFRHMKPADLPGEMADIATVDVSFISLSLILPPLTALLKAPADVVALVKPQFEAGREQVGRKGIVRDPGIHRKVLARFAETATTEGFSLRGLAPSPITGSGGNIEFLSWLRRSSPEDPVRLPDLETIIGETVEKAHSRED
ncbi:TlyA family rRNA (cytidine-2'-O)-methyltransferase [Kroppenstedtia guangzhouensis]|uniref:TlyA family rRNA (Cytidine-2'-O)-methyltransferase n=1 Tax=Kroppenstedtia guangzhouensis TaxID=1274356 RepID=A0ABQ1G9Z8_9BACL|nr:TlyA family RNA methyltransferase [Kroppenstedtia guangzhouensis]GGA39642.1 TlyA family rRNA (cytidine-2'-O)-methyltransferase [Kroppenstedtia guangzhouensis]